MIGKTPDQPELAIQGGTPVRRTMLPYGRQWLDEEDVQAVVEVLRSDYLTTGPKVAEFEREFAALVGAREAVAVSNGTAALHAAVSAAGIGPGDEVITSPMTFAATANCVVFQGGTPVFADVDPKTLLVDPAQVEAKITQRTRAIIAVDYAGQPCDYDALRQIADRRGLTLIADSCHALGARYKDRPVGSLADMTTFSFHPVKHITTGEGGMISTDDPGLAKRIRLFRNHGINADHRERERRGSWFYEIVDIGYNYRITDFQCALGICQIRKLDSFTARRRAIACRYDKAFTHVPQVSPLETKPEVSHVYHLYVILLELERLRTDRASVFAALRAEGIGVNVHYIPVHLHPFYRQRFKTKLGDCPASESAYERLISLPMFAGMDDEDVDDVIEAVHKVVMHY